MCADVFRQSFASRDIQKKGQKLYGRTGMYCAHPSLFFRAMSRRLRSFFSNCFFYLCSTPRGCHRPVCHAAPFYAYTRLLEGTACRSEEKAKGAIDRITEELEAVAGAIRNNTAPAVRGKVRLLICGDVLFPFLHCRYIGRDFVLLARPRIFA